MEIAEFIQKFFLLFLPGIVGMLVYNQINIREEQQGYVESLKLVCLSLASYLLTDGLFWALRRIPGFPWGPVNIVEVIAAEEIRLPAANVFSASVFAVVLVCLLTKAVADNWFFGIARRLSLTKRAGNQPVWEMAFDYGNTVVFRDLVTENTYCGKVMFFSDNSDIREILLRDVVVYDSGSAELYRTSILYLSREHNQFTMEIQNPLSGRGGGRSVIPEQNERRGEAAPRAQDVDRPQNADAGK